MRVRNLKTWGGKRGWLVLGAALLAGCGGGGSDGDDGAPSEFATSAACIDPAVLRDGTTIDTRYQETVTDLDGRGTPEREVFRMQRHNRLSLLTVEGQAAHPLYAIRQAVTFDGEDDRFETEHAWQRRPNGVIDWYILNRFPAVAGTGLQDPGAEATFTRPCEDHMWTLRRGEEARFSCTIPDPTFPRSYEEIERTSRYSGLQRVTTPAGRFDACVFHESEQTYEARYGYRTSTERTRWIVRGIDVRVDERVTDNDGDAYRIVTELQAAAINGQLLVP